MGQFRQRVKRDNRDVSPASGPHPDVNLRESFVHTAIVPEKEGWMEYRIGGFYRKGYFTLHGHYVSFTSSVAGIEDRGSINLWSVQEIALDNREILLTLSERALQRSPKLLRKTSKVGPLFRIRATTTTSAADWLQAMRTSGVEGGQASDRLPTPMSGGGWEIRSLQLLDSNGQNLHTLTNVVDGATDVQMRLGSGLDPAARLEVQVNLAGPRGETARGSQDLALADRQGSLDIHVHRTSGEAMSVLMSWRAEPMEDSLVPATVNWQEQLQQPPVMAVAGASLLSFLLSTWLFLIVAAAGGYWVANNVSRPLDRYALFITEIQFQTRRTQGNLPSSMESDTPIATTQTDKSITSKETKQLAELRQMVQPLKEGGSGVAPEVFEAHVNVDYRLVRYLRARPTIPEAADMVKESLRWRTEHGSETIFRHLKLQPWALNYFASPAFIDCLKDGVDADRLGCYQRDNKGHLTLIFRGGLVDWKKAFHATHGNEDVMQSYLCWCFEMVRTDLEKLHEQTQGGVPSYISIVWDLEGFEYGKQVAPQTMVPIAQKFMYMMNINYPEMIYRIHIIRAPWLFSSIWALLKPLIPQGLLVKISLTGGGKVSKILPTLTPTMPVDQIPKFLGGTLVDQTGDEDCRYNVLPRGPLLPDLGDSLLDEGIANPPKPDKIFPTAPSRIGQPPSSSRQPVSTRRR